MTPDEAETLATQLTGHPDFRVVRRLKPLDPVELTSKVDPSILGGIVLRVGNSILDASIKHRLDQLRKHVAQA